MVSKLTSEEQALRKQQVEQLKAFATAKEKQALSLASDAGETVSAEARRYFEAAKTGDVATVRSNFAEFMKRHRQYAASSKDTSLDTSYWQTLLEVNLGYECVIPMDPKTVKFVVDGTVNAIPPGSIYFGGTDSGRGLPTTFSKSQPEGHPFFTITQNALADSTYLKYLRRMYGEKISIPTDNDSTKCFNDYMKDAQERMEYDMGHPGAPRKIKPGEDVHIVDGRVQVSGQIAVMEINALLAKNIFDHNPDRELYIEESFPLDWMFPHLEPHGPIMELNHKKVETLSDATVTKDREYWQGRVKAELGDWLTEQTPVSDVAEFVEKVFVRKNLNGFSGNPRFLDSGFSQKMVSKLRSSIAGLYDWRSEHSESHAEKERMAREADLAYRQAFALCPYSPEAVFRYVQFLTNSKRIDDAILVATAGLKVDPKNKPVADLLKSLKQYKQQLQQK
jgi:hypothetical protein